MKHLLAALMALGLLATQARAQQSNNDVGASVHYIYVMRHVDKPVGKQTKDPEPGGYKDNKRYDCDSTGDGLHSSGTNRAIALNALFDKKAVTFKAAFASGLCRTAYTAFHVSDVAPTKYPNPYSDAFKKVIGEKAQTVNGDVLVVMHSGQITDVFKWQEGSSRRQCYGEVHRYPIVGGKWMESDKSYKEEIEKLNGGCKK